MTSVPLVVGGSGLLGSHLLELRPEAAGTFRRVPRPGLIPLDLADASACRSLLERLHPSPVVIAQNPPSLDWCESHESSSLREQVTDLALFLDLLRRTLPAARVVYLSTDYVFDGTDPPYHEEQQPRPVQCYGRHKLAAEELVSRSGLDCWIVRTSVLYGESRWEPESTRYLPLQVIDRARRGQRLRITDNLWSCPTEVRSLAAAVWSLANLPGDGVVHAAGGPSVTRFELVRAILSAWGLPEWPGLERMSADEQGRVPGQALARPRDSSLDSTRLSRLLGHALPDLPEGLRAVRDRIGPAGRS